jgi:hypothetical protein
MKRKPHATKTVSCPSCLASNDRHTAFCHECGSPIGAVATIDPVQSARAEAFSLSKAIERPNLMVLLVIGIPALLVVIGGTAIAVKTLLYESGGNGFIYFWMMMGASLIAFLILYRVTKNYFTKHKKK